MSTRDRVQPSEAAVPGALVQQNFLDDLTEETQQNRAVPPHAMTAENEKIIGTLEKLVEWEKSAEANSLVQPMWGQLREKRADGTLRIHWMIGPNEARDAEAILSSRDVPSALQQIEVGRWFYGTAKCYPGRIEWIDSPFEVPDPDDPVARAKLWDQLDLELANEPGCWPVRKP